tara:strand:- start:209 stop:493 length:285 start_codon:yes stop_codon:yes gene_type:complete
MPYTVPSNIKIPTPDTIPIGFGPNSTGKRGGNLRVRCTDNEYDAIKHEAELLNITLATFTRWCAVHVAQELLQHRLRDNGEYNESTISNSRRGK